MLVTDRNVWGKKTWHTEQEKEPMAGLPLQGDAKIEDSQLPPPRASSNQDNITLLPFAKHLSCLETVPANVISTTMFGDLPVFSYNQVCCLCTPRSLCSYSEMSLRADSHSLGARCPEDIYSCLGCNRMWMVTRQTKKHFLQPTRSSHLNREAHIELLSGFTRFKRNSSLTEVRWVMRTFNFCLFSSHCAKKDTRGLTQEWRLHT